MCQRACYSEMLGVVDGVFSILYSNLVTPGRSSHTRSDTQTETLPIPTVEFRSRIRARTRQAPATPCSLALTRRLWPRLHRLVVVLLHLPLHQHPAAQAAAVPASSQRAPHRHTLQLHAGAARGRFNPRPRRRSHDAPPVAARTPVFPAPRIR